MAGPHRIGINSALTAALTVLFLALRIFTDTPFYYIGFGDEAGFFRLAENFPFHRLYGNDLYLIHPPLYFYALRFFLPIADPHVGGLLLSLISAVLFWIVVLKLFELFKIDHAGRAFGLLYIAALNLCIAQQGSISREPFMMMLFWGALTFFLEGLTRKSASLWISLLLGIATAWTTDLVVLLFPALVLCWFFFGEPENRKRAAAVFFATLAAYCIWLGIRGMTYWNHDVFPAGIDGTIESTHHFTPAMLFNPNFLHETYLNGRVFVPPLGISLRNARTFVLNPFWNPSMILEIILVLVAVLANVRALRAKGWRNPVLCFTAVALVLLLPSLLGQWPRYGLLGIPAVAFVISEGMAGIKDVASTRINVRFVPHFWIGICLLMTGIWILGHPVFTFNTRMIIKGEAVAKALSQLPEGTIMSPIGLPSELTYLTKWNCLALPMSPQIFLNTFERYQVRYIVVPESEPTTLSPQLRHSMSLDTIDVIAHRPEQFAVIAVIGEKLQVAFNWQQRVSWNPTRVPADQTTEYLIEHNYDIYSVHQIVH